MSELAIDVVKRGGRRPSEGYTRDKLFRSIVAACLSVGSPIGSAETVAILVCTQVEEWLSQKPEITSHDLRRIAAKHLTVHHPEAAYLYEQHRITI